MKLNKIQNGVTILLFTSILLLTLTSVFLLSTSMVNVEKKLIDNAYQVKQAYANAEAGLQYGITRLSRENTIDLSKPIQNKRFLIQYKKINYKQIPIIIITAVGYSDNKKINAKIHQKVFFNSVLKKIPNNSKIITHDFQKSFIEFFNGNLKTTYKLSTLKLYANSSYDFSSSINRKYNSLIFITQQSGNAIIGNSTQLGTLQEPMILIVNGNLRLTQSAKIYGLVFVTRNLTLQDRAKIEGAAMIGKKLDLFQQANITLNEALLKKLQKMAGYYLTIPGSWKDF